MAYTSRVRLKILNYRTLRYKMVILNVMLKFSETLRYKMFILNVMLRFSETNFRIELFILCFSDQ